MSPRLTVTEPDPYAEGYDARIAGLFESRNPYIGINGAYELLWAAGWAEAAEGVE